MRIPDAFREGWSEVASDRRLRRLPRALRDESDEPLLLYRGTRLSQIEGRQKTLSFTDSLPAAMIWSSLPPDPWSDRKERHRASFVPGSTIHAVHLAMFRPLVWRHNHLTMGDVLRSLHFGEPGGIPESEARRIYLFLNRFLRDGCTMAGGPFKYRFLDHDGEYEEEEEEVDLLEAIRGRTRIYGAMEEFESEGMVEADRLVVDTFAFADAPAVRRAAIAIGHDGLIYPDVFAGGSGAAEDLCLGEIEDLDGVFMEDDLQDDEVPMHLTYRPCSLSQVIPVGTARPRDLMDQAQEAITTVPARPPVEQRVFA